MRSTRTQPVARPAGFIVAEVLVSLGLLALLMVLLFELTESYRKSRDYYLLDQSLRWAVEGQVDRLRAGAPLDAEPPPELLPKGARMTVTAEPGVGPWERTVRVIVSASAQLKRGPLAQCRMVVYLPEEAAR